MSDGGDFPYADIVNLPVPNSKRYQRMSSAARAAQFAPFAALTGYEDAVDETARYTVARIELDNDQKLLISETLSELADQLPQPCFASISYFQEDPVKLGGTYLFHRGRIKRIDPYQEVLIFSDGLKVAFENLFSVQKVLPQCD